MTAHVTEGIAWRVLHGACCSAARWGAGAYLHLGLDRCGLLGTSGDEGEAAGPLPVQAHVLGVRLGAAQLVAVRQKGTDRLSVARAVAAGKALRQDILKLNLKINIP